jgi:hypothetical protein
VGADVGVADAVPVVGGLSRFRESLMPRKINAPTSTRLMATAIKRAFVDFVSPESACGGTGAGLVGAAWVGAPAESICSFRACAKSAQRWYRSSGRLARPMASTGSSLARLGRLSASAGGGTLRWWLMTTAGFEFGNN